CGKIADGYASKDSRIQVIHQKNAGVSASRNIGLEKATGEYICIIDQDDCISLNYVSYFYKLIQDNDAQIALVPTADKFFGEPKEDNRED
ncbi:glycosyltransferase family 2 protein, partial [Enterococcus faecalis]|uniref:glycosyltransferase family 2 protein n=1 Tax=Enterococcus faecalis TaxID=1351 RepID=UPI003D6ABBE1